MTFVQPDPAGEKKKTVQTRGTHIDPPVSADTRVDSSLGFSLRLIIPLPPASCFPSLSSPSTLPTQLPTPHILSTTPTCPRPMFCWSEPRVKPEVLLLMACLKMAALYVCPILQIPGKGSNCDPMIVANELLSSFVNRRSTLWFAQSRF